MIWLHAATGQVAEFLPVALVIVRGLTRYGRDLEQQYLDRLESARCLEFGRWMQDWICNPCLVVLEMYIFSLSYVLGLSKITSAECQRRFAIGIRLSTAEAPCQCLALLHCGDLHLLHLHTASFHAIQCHHQNHDDGVVTTRPASGVMSPQRLLANARRPWLRF
jgi:hypothetical protein